MDQQPKIEYYSQAKQTIDSGNAEVVMSNIKYSRTKVFLCSFVIFLLAGIVINYSRPATYQSNATLLTSAAVAIDKSNIEADYQHVTIQKHKILGYEILKSTLEQLNSKYLSTLDKQLTLPEIQRMLNVEIIDQTNLVKLIAEGTRPELLANVINTWIEVYLQARADSVKHSADDTIQLINNELAELKIKIEQARFNLDQFRNNNNISSIVREENSAPAILIGLTESYNKASEEVVKTKAKLDAINQSIARGEAVVPETDQTTLSNLETRHQELSEKLAEFDKRFTRDYLSLQPSLKFIPEQIKELEKQIKSKKNTGKSIVWTEANQEYLAAVQVEQQIKQKLESHKKNTAKFTTLFAEHQALINDLESLELINRETKDRLIKVESKGFDKYPQIEVVEPASINFDLISPDYNIGSLLAFIAALILAFFAVWLVEFLYQGRVKLTEVNYPLSAAFEHIPQNEGLTQSDSSLLINEPSHPKLPQHSIYQKIPQATIARLLGNVSQDVQQLCLLLLSGLTLREIADLRSENINVDAATIDVTGDSPRTISIGRHIQEMLKQSVLKGHFWTENRFFSEAELTALLYCAQVDLAIDELTGDLVQRIRQTYIIYLVEQGVSLASLAAIVGYLSPLELAGYAEFVLPEKAQNKDYLQKIYPLCG